MSERRVAQVASGILLSRVAGLVREKVAAHFLGVGAFGDVFALVFRGPNLLQNLLGEQALSASFIPVYSRKLTVGGSREAADFAGAVFALLTLTVSIVVVAGVVFADAFVAVLNPGLLGDAAAVAAGTREVDRFPIAVAGVRLVFPMAALLVLSAWCLGVLNSHRRFVLPYSAPVLWNLAIIGAVVWTGTVGEGDGEQLVIAACAGALLGAVLQFGVQLGPAVVLVGGLRLRLSLAVSGVREALRRFGPAVAGRSAAQISGYLDLAIASFLAVGTLSALGWAQRLYLLPIALFGLSIAAVELPELSRLSEEERSEKIPERFAGAFGTAGFLLAPTLVAFLGFGYVAVGLLYRGGRFGAADNWLVYLVLVAYSIGLPATVTSRLLQNVFFSAGDTRSPARVAFVRLVVSGALGAAAAFALDRVPLSAVVPVEEASRLSLAPIGLALASAVGAWTELSLLASRLRRRVPSLRIEWRKITPALAVAVAAAAPAAAVWWLLQDASPGLAGVCVLGLLGGCYLAVARWVDVPGRPSLASLRRGRSAAP